MTDNSFGEYHRRLSRENRREPLYPFKPLAPLPPNTLTNSDGTPYSAGHDATIVEQIRKCAQNALETGRTWPVEDRLHSLEDALKDIVKLCHVEKSSQ